MATQAGSYDNPSYLTRQMIHLGVTRAGNAAVKNVAFPSAVRVRALSFVAEVAGTSAGHTVIVRNGTTALATATLGTSANGVIVSVADLNSALAVGTALNFVNSTDATGVVSITAELHIDPATGTWNAP